MNVPDSIEPVIGWKALRIINGNDGPRLLSPHYSHAWQVQKPTNSYCHVTRPYWAPFASANEAIESLQEAVKWRRHEEAQQLRQPTMVGYTTTGSYVAPSGYPPEGEHVAITPAGKMGPAPTIVLPGKHWGIQRRRLHPPGPGEGCSCGIYIASEAETARAYMIGRADTVLVKVAGWGVVIPHDRGWRVQHAYPKEIHLDQENEYADALAETYGCTIINWYSKRALNPPPAGTEIESPYRQTAKQPQPVKTAGSEHLFSLPMLCIGVATLVTLIAAVIYGAVT